MTARFRSSASPSAFSIASLKSTFSANHLAYVSCEIPAAAQEALRVLPPRRASVSLATVAGVYLVGLPAPGCAAIFVLLFSTHLDSSLAPRW